MNLVRTFLGNRLKILMDALNGKATEHTTVKKQSGTEALKQLSYSTQLSMKFFLLINVKMPSNVGISTFMSMKNYILDISEPEKKNTEFLCKTLCIHYTYEHLKCHAQLS